MLLLLLLTCSCCNCHIDPRQKMLEERGGLSNCVATPAPKPSKTTVLTLWRCCCWRWGTEPRKPRRWALPVLLLWPLLLLLVLQVLPLLGCLWQVHN
jgi:hypothetical protein